MEKSLAKCLTKGVKPLYNS